MEKALLEEHVRYGEARFRDKELVRPFVNRIYQDLAELEEAMKPKTCEGCRHSDTCDILHSLYLNMLKIQGYAMNKNEFGCNKHQPKDNA